MDQISDQLHSKIHSLETMFLDTDDLLWEVNHKAYQDEPAVMKKVNDDLKTNFSQLRKKVIDISKLMKGYICLLYTSPSPRDQRGSRMPSSA